MITINNITFSYNGTPVIDKLSLNVPDGNWLGLIGPNGAGKTTLLKLISGILVPDIRSRRYEVRGGKEGVENGKQESSRIMINGKSLSTYSRKEMAKLIAVVPQVNEFPFPFTVMEVVLMGRNPYLKKFGFETKADMEIAQDAMEKTDTWQFRDRPIDQLSGGERQRVLIARALAQQPKIMLLDEPTTFLDIRHQLDIMNILKELNRSENMTIIAALHDVNLAISYCKEIALLVDSNIYKLGNPEDVVTYSNLKKIFGAEVYVGTNEFTGKPYYLPMTNEAGDRRHVPSGVEGQEARGKV